MQRPLDEYSPSLDIDEKSKFEDIADRLMKAYLTRYTETRIYPQALISEIPSANGDRYKLMVVVNALKQAQLGRVGTVMLISCSADGRDVACVVTCPSKEYCESLGIRRIYWSSIDGNGLFDPRHFTNGPFLQTIPHSFISFDSLSDDFGIGKLIKSKDGEGRRIVIETLCAVNYDVYSGGGKDDPTLQARVVDSLLPSNVRIAWFNTRASPQIKFLTDCGDASAYVQFFSLDA